jgi:tRNA uridine 5-carboxymethylaminomethyl modification enzyme
VLRHDNADLRLTPVGREIGLVDDAAWEAFESRRGALNAAIAGAERARLPVTAVGDETFAAGATLADALRRPRLSYGDVAPYFDPPPAEEIGERAAIEIKSAGYVRRQELAIEKAAKSERVLIPDDFNYAALTALSHEAREKLAKQRPRTLGAASRIPGVTPSDVAIVGLFICHPERSRGAAETKDAAHA